MRKARELREASPTTEVWIDNRTGKPIREVGMLCCSAPREDRSRSYWTSWTRSEDIDKEPQMIWSDRYPEPFVLEEFKVRYDEGGWATHPLDYRCRLGESVVIVLEAGGRVSIQTKE